MITITITIYDLSAPPTYARKGDLAGVQSVYRTVPHAVYAMRSFCTVPHAVYAMRSFYNEAIKDAILEVDDEAVIYEGDRLVS